MNLPLIVFILCFVTAFLIRIPIGFGMMMSCIFYFSLATGPAASVSMVANQFLGQLSAKFILIAVPLFIFAAKLMNSTKLTDMLFTWANTIVGRWKGGLGHVNVIASLIFSGMTGSALADAAGLGMIEIEEMRKQGYDDGFSGAITAASATIGPVFPPSIPMIFYSMLSGASVGALFMGGMVPGVILAIALMIYVAFIARKRNYPTAYIPYTLIQWIVLTGKSLPALLTPVILLGGIYSGIVTPTEAGAIAALWAILVSFIFYKMLGFKELWIILIDSVKATAIVSVIVGSAFSFAYILSIEQIPQMLSAGLLGLTENKYVLLLVINIIFLILGMFSDVMTITVVYIPIVLPLIRALGIDLVHFGVVIVLNMMIGLSTPPWGALLFLTSGISKIPMHKIIKETLPMSVVMIIVLFLITYIPELVLFLPRLFLM